MYYTILRLTNEFLNCPLHPQLGQQIHPPTVPRNHTYGNKSIPCLIVQAYFGYQFILKPFPTTKFRLTNPFRNCFPHSDKKTIKLIHAYLRRPNVVTISIPYLPGRNLRQQIHSSTVSYTTFRLSNAVLNCLWHHAYVNNSIPVTSPALKPRLANPFLTCFRKPNSVNKCVPNRVSTKKVRLTNPFLNCSPHLDLPASAGQI